MLITLVLFEIFQCRIGQAKPGVDSVGGKAERVSSYTSKRREADLVASRKAGKHLSRSPVSRCIPSFLFHIRSSRSMRRPIGVGISDECRVKR